MTANIIFLFQHFCGFLLQLVPSFVLLIVPFGRSSCRIRYKYMFFLLITGLFLAAAGFSFLLLFFRGNYAGSLAAADIYMGLSIVCCAVLFFFLNTEPFQHKLITVCLSCAYGITSYFGTNLLIHAAPISAFFVSEYQVYDPLTIFYYAVFSVLTLPVCIRFEHRTMRNYFENTTPVYLKRHCFILAILTMSYFAVLVFMDLYAASLDSRPEIMPMQLMCFIFSTICLIIVYWLLFQESRQIRRQEEMEKLVLIQQLQYKTLKNEIDSTHRARHDMRHMYRTIAELIDEGKEEDIKKILTEGDVYISGLETKFFCKEPAVNALLQYYYAQAIEKNISIRISARLDQMLYFNVVDIVLMLGNMLENAIRSCMIAEDTRFIELVISFVGNKLAIYMENSCTNVHFNTSGRSESGKWLPASSFLSTKQ
ncbi:MAG TPA: GHKL domain-containing protein, partial [Lachnospiraceae bacterium]|nr:GHKL domain-containing protein [Lachnospiraceae bacterium]